MKKLAQALLDEYPNQEVVIFFNPYFVDGLIKLGSFTDADTLAEAILDMKQDLAITEVLDINWFDVFLKNEPETLDTDWIDAVTEDDTMYLLTIMTVNGPVTAAGTLGNFSKHLGQSFNRPEDLEKAVAESTDYLNAFSVDEWGVGQVTVKAIDKMPDEVSFVL